MAAQVAPQAVHMEAIHILSRTITATEIRVARFVNYDGTWEMKLYYSYYSPNEHAKHVRHTKVVQHIYIFLRRW